MKNYNHSIIIGIGFSVAIMTIFSGCTTISGQDKQDNLQDFTGSWQIVSTHQGNQTKEADGFIRLEQNGGRLLGSIDSSKGQLELIPEEDQQQLTGNIYLTGVSEHTIQIPVRMKLSENKQDLTLVVMTTKLDKNLLPSKFSQSLPENFTSEDITLTSRRSMNDNTFGTFNKARQNVVAMNRAQQAYFLEKNSFTSDFSELGIGSKPETGNYFYSINLLGDKGVQTLAIPKQEGLRSYTGGVFAINHQASNQMITIASLCESEQPTNTPAVPPRLIGKDIQCPPGFQKLNK